ncbi:ribonuclease D [uncultured Pseudomonas sp.]|uniref:ribonuclease D n=1 Tax=uncultured Pseudomonas sp. TaxID=114707 RepID=UPI0025873703|nr:ribonuclease D [uncultured Pseudomonas sp.]
MTSAPHWIRDDAALAALCARCQTLPFIALDTEFMRVDTFYPKAGLIQIGDGEQAYLVDPLCIGDWTPFAALLEDPAVVKVLHACSEDLEVLLRLTGSLPQPLYDTQLAAAYLGLAHSMGYSRLVAEVLKIDIPKDETRSDWLQRPLTPLQERYAAADVTYLVDVYLYLDARLDDQRRAWLLEDGAELVANLRRVSDPWEAYRDVKLAWRLSRQQLAVLRVLCHWREVQARERDQPRNHVLRERSLWPLARFQPTDKQALARIDDMHPRTVRQDGDTLLALIAEGAATPAEQWPALQSAPLPHEASPLLKALRAIGERDAEALGMAPELMLRKKVLEALLRTGWPDGDYQLPDNLRGWRRERFGQALLDHLQAQRTPPAPLEDTP